MADNLQCQFCPLKFSSTYKLIPHVFFGHRKKVLKKINKKEDVIYKCPAGCGYESRIDHNFKTGCKQDDEFVSWFSNSLIPIEIHINTHTKEVKATRCEYCSLELGTTIYWNHIQDHMPGKSDGNSPDKIPAAPLQGGEAPTSTSQILPGPATIIFTPTTSTSVKQSTPESKPTVTTSGGNYGGKLRPPSPPGPPPPSSPSPPPSPPLQTAKAPEELAASTIPFSSFFKKKSSSPESKLKSVFNIDESYSRNERPKEDLSLTTSLYTPCNSSSSISTSSLPSSSASTSSRSTDSLAGISSRSSLVDSVFSKTGRDVDNIKGTQSGVADTITKVSQIIATEPKSEPVSNVNVEPKQQTPKQKISFSEYTKMRKKQLSSDDSVKPVAKTTPAEEKVSEDTLTSPSLTDKASIEQKSSNLDSVESSTIPISSVKERKVSVESYEVQELTTERRTSLEYNEKKPRQMSGDSVSKQISADSVTAGKTIKPPKLADAEVMRPPTPLDQPPVHHGSGATTPVGPSTTPTPSGPQPTTPITAPSPEASSRSTTPGLSRPTTPADRSRRPSADQRSRRLSDTSKEKPKPVVTEEMERQIIFGGALMKGTKLNISSESLPSRKSEEKSEKSSPTEERDTHERSISPEESKSEQEIAEEKRKQEKEDRERKRKQEERDKMSREQKLAAVRREIELRFQEEELKRKRDKEAQKKHDDELREKIRIEEEKLKKEKEKILLEKKRVKDEKRKAKKNKRKRKTSGDHDKSSSDDETIPKKPKYDETEHNEESKNEDQEEEHKDTIATAEPIRPKSPDQYEKLKLTMLSKQREALEKELEMLDSEQVEAEKEEKIKEDKSIVEEPIIEEDMEEEDDDDLESMMRRFVQKEQEGEGDSVEAVSSLSMLMSNYEEIDDQDESMEVIDVDVEDASKENQEVETIIDDTEEEIKADEPIQILDDEPRKSEEMDEETLLAATNAAMDIMAPAKRNKRMKAASQLICSLCKENGSSNSFLSAYQLLSHVYLTHRTKIIARSRKNRGMTLSCPEGCGYITSLSKDGTSKDYFADEFPKHLEMLCEHIRDSHTGEPEMETCQYCSLPLKHKENWSWQHLANHRNTQRFYCGGCNNFPFKNEVHKCPSSGLETYHASTETTDSNNMRKRTLSEEEVLGKSLDDLEREADVGGQHHASRQTKHLGNLVRFMCGACEKVVTNLSSWLVHIRLDHLGRGHINQSQDVRCFCCAWMPQRFEKGREIIGINNLVQHLITEHHSEDWKDPDFTLESCKLIQVQRDMERRLETEREEAAINVPKLPAPCNTCNRQIGTTKIWRYHVLAHKFGEVFCASCRTFILGHHFLEHTAVCNAEDQNRVKVEIRKIRADTVLCTKDHTYKVNFKYENVHGVGSMAVARTMIGTRVVFANGSNYEEAARAVKEQVENILTEKKLQDEEARKDEIEREDKDKLLNIFRQLIEIDKEEEDKSYYLNIDGDEVPVCTKFHFTKTGKSLMQASIIVRGQHVQALGNTRYNSVSNLADKVRSMTRSAADHQPWTNGNDSQGSYLRVHL